MYMAFLVNFTTILTYNTIVLCTKMSYYLVFHSFDFKRTWLRLFQKRVVRTKFDIFVVIISKCHKKICSHHELAEVLL
jgi:hypothetical protein